MGRLCSIVCLIFQRLCDDYQCGGAQVLVFEKFCSPFSFLLFFLFSIFFFVSLSGALLAPGPLDIVHPCHPVATPLNIGFLFQPESIPGHTQKDHLNTYPEAELNKVTKTRQSLGQYVWTFLCNHCATPHATTGIAVQREVSATHFHNCKQVCKP